tara:strand:- start:572 stop:1471 length:900 start_codon:yes stop_codon:yes gene_type:complete
MLSIHKLKITPEMLSSISQIDEFKGSWNALEQHTTALNLLGDVANFGQNFRSVIEPLRHKSINKDMLVKLHMSVLKQAEPSDYKSEYFPIVVQHGEKMIGSLDTAAPEEVAALMENLLGWLEKSLDDEHFHPLLVIALLSVLLLQIGPFKQGNQKLMRLLVTLLMLRYGYNYAPYISIEHIFFERSASYYNALFKVQENIEEGRMDFAPWIDFFLECLKAQKDELQMRMSRESKKISGLPSLSIKVMKLFDKHERLQMKEIERLTRGRRSTLKLRLAELVDEGYLKRYGQARSTWYSKI